MVVMSSRPYRAYLKRVKMVSLYKKPYKRTKTKIGSYESTSGGNGGIRNVEGRYDAVRGHRTGSNKSPPLSVPVSPSPVSREARCDFLALVMWLHTRYRYLK